MALDHYIPQVYLRRFNTQESIDGFWGMSKKKLTVFPTKSKDVCRIDDYNTNIYFEDERVVEDFLAIIEPNINRSIEKIRSDEIDYETIYTISGLISYICSCSPCAVRLSTKILKENVEDFTIMADEYGMFPSYKTEDEELRIGELIKNGKVKVKIDDKYPHAIGISGILKTLSRFGNWPWEIMVNNSKDCFCTSDFPIGIEKTKDLRVLNKVFPLTPRIAIRLYPDIYFEGSEKDIRFEKFRYKKHEIGRSDVKYINKLIIKTAENIVFFKEKEENMIKLIRKYSKWYIEQKLYKIPSGKGHYIITRQELKEKSALKLNRKHRSLYFQSLHK